MSDAKPTLVPLTSIRFLAALHILLFHVSEGERVPSEMGQTPPFALFSELSAWLTTVVQRGYCSTSLFFLLSGVVLTYLYLDREGRLSVARREFWEARLARIYPFHMAVLALLALIVLPLVTFAWLANPDSLSGAATPLGGPPTLFGFPISFPLYLAIGVLLNAFLLQAWFPEFALSGNFPTWALSTVVFFYGVFPFVAPWLARLGRAAQWALAVILPGISLIPSAIFMSVAEQPRGLTLASEFLYRFPPLWLPHFLMGILVARLAGLTRHGEVDIVPCRRPGLGDAAAVILVIAMAIPDATWSDWLGLGDWRPNLILRHGLLAPLFMILAGDLARSRGCLAWLLSHPWLKALGATSFSIFILQLPFMAIAAGIAFLPIPALVRLTLIVAVTGLLSWLADRYLDQPLARWARRRFHRRHHPNVAT